MRERPGTEIKLVGTGFCQGTQVEIGNSDAIVDADVASDGLSLKFRVPRLATTGPVTIKTPGAASYLATDDLDVRSFRNYYGYQFKNFKWGSLSFAELTDVVGIDEMFARVNPCWPIYDCSVRTGLPSPEAYASWLVLKKMAPDSGAHCFGMVRAQQEFLAGTVGYDRFLDGADHPYQLASPSGPGSQMRHHLDGRHVAQWTEEFARKFLFRSKEVDDQVALIRSELRAGRYPGVSLFPEGQTTLGIKTVGHVVTAYDVEETGPGDFTIYVYDNNRPFVEGQEVGPGRLDEHREREIGSKGVILVKDGRWEFLRKATETWSGTGGTIWAFTFSDLPADPTLIGAASLLTLTFSMGQFASDDGAAQMSAIPDGAEWLPPLDSDATPMVAGTLLAPGSHTLKHTVTGAKDGTYSELIAGKGFLGALTDVPTKVDVTDQIEVEPNDRTLKFAGEFTRPIGLTVTAALPDGGTNSVLVRTNTADGGRELVRIDRDGAVVYEHHGATTDFSFELSSSSQGTSVARFMSPPLSIADGDIVIGNPEDWNELATLRLELRHPDGTSDMRLLKTEPLTGALDVRIGQPTVDQVDTGNEVVVETIFDAVPDGSVGGIVQELRRDGKVVASRGLAVLELSDGTRTERWPLPAELESGTYALTTHVNVITGGPHGATKGVTTEAPLILAGDSGGAASWPLPLLVGALLLLGLLIASAVIAVLYRRRVVRNG
jgi:hypothetical protein